MAKLRAAGARSELDVAYMDSQIVKQAKAEGLLQPLEPAKVAHWNDVYDVSRDKDAHWVSMMFAGTMITYNTKLVKEPPTSWADLWKPEFKGKLAIPDISGTSGQQFLMAAARLNGGSIENIDPGFEAIKKLKPNVQMMYTQPDQLIPLFERGDIAVAVWYTDRTGAAAAKGVPVAAAYPKEGADRHRADRLRAQGEPEEGARAEVHRHAALAGRPALLCAVAVRGTHATRRSSSRRIWPSSCPMARSCSACTSPTRTSSRRSSRSGRSAGGARSRGDRRPGATRAVRRAAAALRRAGRERAEPSLAVRRLRKTFGRVVAVDDVSLEAAPGEFLSLLGPSGCGKSTVLRMVAGLVEPDRGEVVLAGEDITRVAVHRRNLGLVFQSYALFPHMTVFDNVAFGLRRRRVAEAELRPRVERMLDLVRLGPLGSRHPRELSGGQQQRVALARALVTEPRVLLLDEPLSNLDALLRDEMRVELKRLQQRLGTTMIFVTHDQAEALILSDRVVVMEAGRVEQVGRPEEVYRRPATAFVARFLGRANFLAGVVAQRGADGIVVALDGGLSVVAAAREDLAAGQRVQVAIRQESIRLCACRPASRCRARQPLSGHRGVSRLRGPGAPLRGPVGGRTRARSGRARRRHAAPARHRRARRVGAGGRDPAARRLRARAPAPGVPVMRGRGGLLLAPSLVLLVLAFAIPVGMLVPTSFRPYVPLVGITSGFTVRYYTKLVTDSYYLEIIGRTLGLGLTVTALTLVIGYPVAFFLARTRSRWRGWLTILVVFPLLLNLVVRTFGWIALLAQNGLVNQAMIALGLVDAPVKLLFNFAGLLIGLTHIFLPFMVLVLVGAIQNIPRDVEDAARVLGASWASAFARVTLPLSLPGVLSGSILVFVLTISALVTPRLLGGPTYQVMSTLIYDEFLQRLNWPAGSAQALLLTVMVLVLVFLSGLLARRTGARV